MHDGIKRKKRLEGGFGNGGAEERSRGKDRGSGGRGLKRGKPKSRSHTSKTVNLKGGAAH